MNNTKGKSQFGSGDAFSDWAAVIIAILLFVRTMDVLSYFSPSVLNDIMGGDVSWIYGGVSAFFIEGVALAYHFNRRAQNYTPAKIVKWVLLSISGICQIFDGRLITGTLSQMPEAQKMVFQIGVPILPLIVLTLLFFVGRLPDEDYERPVWRGVKNIAAGKWERFLNGDGEVVSVQSSTSSPALAPLPAPEPQIDPQLLKVIEEVVRQSNNGNGQHAATGAGGQQGSNFPNP